MMGFFVYREDLNISQYQKAGCYRFKGLSKSGKTATLNKIPLKRFGKAGVAKLVAFLSGDDAAFITGSEYVIDGGTNVNAIIG